MGYFIFKNRNSKDFGVVERTPVLIRNKRTLSITNIPGNTPVFSWGGRESGTIPPITLGIRDVNNTDLIDDLMGWLTGDGPLIVSSDTSKYMWAYCSAELVPNRISQQLGKVIINFVVEPYRYAIDNPEIKLTLTQHPKNADLWETNVNNTGNTGSAPVIKIIGSGDVKLWVNHEGIEIKNVSGGAIVDISTLRVKDLSGNIILNQTFGDPSKFITQPGNNYLEFTKNVSEAYITMNTRWE